MQTPAKTSLRNSSDCLGHPSPNGWSEYCDGSCLHQRTPHAHAERPTGKYALHIGSDHYEGGVYVLVYRNGLFLTQAHERDAAAAVRAARRNVRVARRCL